jgi:hypothetical protein
MAAILTPSLSQTHFCKSDNCGISKGNLYRVFKSFLSEISTAATVPSSCYFPLITFSLLLRLRLYHRYSYFSPYLLIFFYPFLFLLCIMFSYFVVSYLLLVFYYCLTPSFFLILFSDSLTFFHIHFYDTGH